MVVYFNGGFVPEDEAKVSVFDRGFLYGDSLFETMRIQHRRVFRWHQHLERFQRGVDQLGFQCPVTLAQLKDAARRLIEANACADGILRLTLSRGVGPRGYSPAGATSPSVVMTLHPRTEADPEPPAEWRLITSSFQVAHADRLATHKTGSKLLQVMARREAEAAGVDEAILVNTHGEVLEATSANLFWLRGDVLYTPPTAVGVLPGITRAVVLEICAAQNLPVKKLLARMEQVKTSDALFLTSSAHGIVAVGTLDDETFPGNPLVQRLQEAYAEVVRKECGGAAAVREASPAPAG
jgi:aminodeoxychorismate lyase